MILANFVKPVCQWIILVVEEPHENAFLVRADGIGSGQHILCIARYFKIVLYDVVF